MKNVVGGVSGTKYFVRSCHGFLTMSRTVLNDLRKYTENKNVAWSPHPMYETYGTSVSREQARQKLHRGARGGDSSPCSRAPSGQPHWLRL